MPVVAVVVLLAVCFLSLELESVEAVPLDLNGQLQVALQQLAELKGNGTFDNCCNVSSRHVIGKINSCIKIVGTRLHH